MIIKCDGTFLPKSGNPRNTGFGFSGTLKMQFQPLPMGRLFLSSVWVKHSQWFGSFMFMVCSSWAAQFLWVLWVSCVVLQQGSAFWGDSTQSLGRNPNAFTGASWSTSVMRQRRTNVQKLRSGMRIVVESEAKEGHVLDEEWGVRRHVQFIGRGHTP